MDRFKTLLNDEPSKHRAHQDKYTHCEQYVETVRCNIMSEINELKKQKMKPYVEDPDVDVRKHLFKYVNNNTSTFHVYPDSPEPDDVVYDYGYIGTEINEFKNTYKLKNEGIMKVILNPSDTSVGEYNAFPINVTSRIPMNKSQKQIVESLKSNLEIIQGPPGTGKSTTIYHIITTRLTGRTVVTSRNNQAIGAVCEKLGPEHTPIDQRGKIHMVVLGPKSRISDVSKPFHIDTVVEEMLKTTPEIIGIDKQIADKKEQMLEGLKRTIMWIDGLELEKQHMERLIVFGEDKCMKGKSRYLTALENFINGEVNQEIRLNGAKTKTPVVDFNPNLESLKSAISKSRNRSGPVICKCENKVLQALDMKKQHLVVKYSRIYTNRIMRKSNVFLCTMSSMWRTKNITTVIIDEAATVADEYMPSVGVCNPKNLIVIGDHKQLVPFTRSKFQPRSFFERVVDNKCHIQMLRVQYRMAPCIGKMVSKIFYKGRLKHGVASKGELRWVDCTSKEEQKGTSKINRGEVKKIVEYVKKIEAKVMVITFYTAQYNLLKQKLGDRVATVDSCQGTEADVVCLSCVRSNDKHDIGFCYNKNRMCVALSRAKKKLIIFGNKNTFSRDYRWKKVLNFV